MISPLEFSDLFDKWNVGNPLTDAELGKLIDGLEFLTGFFSCQKNQPLFFYYFTKLEAATSAMNFRLGDRTTVHCANA